MIISKDNQGNWTPVATGNGTFVGTKAAFDAVKDDLPDNTVAYTTDDGTALSNLIVTENIIGTGITISTSPTSWSISATKSGYKPIAYTIKGNNLSDITWGVELDTFGDGTFSCQGYAKSTSFSGTLIPVARVTWMKI